MSQSTIPKRKRDIYDFDVEEEEERAARVPRRLDLPSSNLPIPAHLRLQTGPSRAPVAPPSYMELFQLPPNATLVAQRIETSPEVRNLELRPGKNLVSLAKGKANLEAALAYTRGTLAATPCASCAKARRPRGPFLQCVIYPGEFDGACCNCRYGDEGTVCTMHRLNANPTSPAPPRSASAVPTTPRPRAATRRSLRAGKMMGRDVSGGGGGGGRDEGGGRGKLGEGAGKEG